MDVIIGLSDGDAIPYTSKYNTLEKVFIEITNRKFIMHEGVLYLTSAFVKVSAV